MKQTPQPVGIVVHRKSRVLEITFDDDRAFRLTFEFLRVHSPSAEVRGHGPGQETLQVGKRDVMIESVEGVGNYGIQPVFDDGHSTGIFSWDYLHSLGMRHDELWADYLRRLEAAGASRDPVGVDVPSVAATACVSGAAGARGPAPAVREATRQR